MSKYLFSNNIFRELIIEIFSVFTAFVLLCSSSGSSFTVITANVFTTTPIIAYTTATVLQPAAPPPKASTAFNVIFETIKFASVEK